MNPNKQPARPIFSAEEKTVIGRMAYEIWNYCAFDILTAVADEKGKHINAVSLPRSHAIEIALDAGRLDEKLRAALRLKAPVVTADLIARWTAADYATKIRIVRPSFSSSRYCM